MRRGPRLPGSIGTRLTNAEIQRRARERAEGRGDCITCRVQPAKPGFKNCESCLADRRIGGKYARNSPVALRAQNGGRP